MTSRPALLSALITTALIASALLSTGFCAETTRLDPATFSTPTLTVCDPRAAEVNSVGTASITSVFRASGDNGCYLGAEKIWFVASGQLGIRFSAPLPKSALFAETGAASSAVMKASDTVTSLLANPIGAASIAVNPYAEVGFRSANTSLSLVYDRLKMSASDLRYSGIAAPSASSDIDRVVLKCTITF